MTAITKNIYFDVLDDIFNKYNNTAHRTIRMKIIYILIQLWKLMIKIQNLKLGIM